MKSITNRYWNVPKKYTPSKEHLQKAGDFRVKPEIIKLLESRGVVEKESIRKFLYPTLQDLEDPLTMRGMEKASSLVHTAITAEDDVIIWGDYDVDGVTSTCLLLRFFHSIGVSPHWFVPDRFSDGYGLDVIKLKEMLNKCNSNSPLLITVDCGITNYDEIKIVQDLGCKVIVTDHHEPGEKENTADAIINVKQDGCKFSDKTLAGVGTAFYLTMGIRSYLTKKGYFNTLRKAPNLKNLLELAAIGTIADMVPLSNCNRILVRAGFEVINSSPSPGLAALMQMSDIKSGNITSDDIAFQIGPKINAAGRISSASKAVDLFLENDRASALKKAKKLTSLNEKRKKLCADCLESTLTTVDMHLKVKCIPLVLEVDFNLGILGIVASQLVEKLKVPVILVTKTEENSSGVVLKGSCRSVPGVNMFEALKESSDSLEKYGGHQMAAGLTVYRHNFKNLNESLNDCLRKQIENAPKVTQDIDIECDLESSLSKQFIKDLQLLEPFGMNNPRPVFVSKSSILTDIRRIGKSKDHLVFKNRGRFTNNKCIGFNFGEYKDDLEQREAVDMIYTVMISRFKQAVSWQANLMDIL